MSEDESGARRALAERLNVRKVRAVGATQPQAADGRRSTPEGESGGVAEAGKRDALLLLLMSSEASCGLCEGTDLVSISLARGPEQSELLPPAVYTRAV